MNLRVDLILEEEQRSGSLISPKFLIRTVSITIPSLLILWGVVFGLGIWRLRSNASAAEKEWKATEPKLAEAKKVRAEANSSRQMLEEIQAWQKTQSDWHDILRRFQAQCPAEIQLTTLRISSSTRPVGGLPERNYTMLLAGKTSGTNAQDHVESLRKQITADPVLKSRIKQVKLVSFDFDRTRDASKEDKVFRIDCFFNPVKPK